MAHSSDKSPTVPEEIKESMTPTDLKSLREVPGCGKHKKADGSPRNLSVVSESAFGCDICLSLFVAAVIRQAEVVTCRNTPGACTCGAHISRTMASPTPEEPTP